MRPVIGLTGDVPRLEAGRQEVVVCSPSYYRAVDQAGGYPVVALPVGGEAGIEAVRATVHGLIFTGGPDLSGPYAVHPDHPRIERLHPLREAWDLALLRAALTWEVPILAVCLGIQELNVACGGTLYPHVPDLGGCINHLRGGEKETFHPVDIVEGTRLHGVLGTRRLEANSSHHQGLATVARPLAVVARADDGLVEAVELRDQPDRFVLGLQWHPERIQDLPAHRRIFDAFVAACAEFARRA